MPAFAELKELQLDPNTKAAVEDIMQTMEAMLPATITNTNISNVQCPVDVFLSLTKDHLQIQLRDGSSIANCELSAVYPSICLSNLKEKSFKLELGPDQTYELITERSVDRDLIAILIRSFCGKKIAEQQTDSYLKIQQLSANLQKVIRENEILQNSMHEMQDKLEAADYQNHTFQSEREELGQRLSETLVKMNQYQKELEDVDVEKKFLRQDISLYKNQCESYQQELERMANNDRVKVKKFERLYGLLSMVLQKIKDCQKCEVLTSDLQYFLTDLKEYAGESYQYQDRQQLVNHQEKLSTELEEQLEINKELISQKEEISTQLAEQVDKLEAERKFYKRKIESLAVENEKLLSKLGKNPNDLTEFEQAKKAFEDEKLAVQQQIDAARASAEAYRITMELTQKRLNDEISRNVQLRKGRRNSQNSSEDFQHVINSLTQQMTEKEYELSEQKVISRQLMNRIIALEAQVKAGTEQF